MKLIRLFALCSLMAIVGCNSTDVDVTVGGGSPTGPSSNTITVSEIRVSTPNLDITLNNCGPITVVFTATVYGSDGKEMKAGIPQLDWIRTGDDAKLTHSGGTNAVLEIPRNGIYAVVSKLLDGSVSSKSTTVRVFGNCGGTNGPGPTPTTSCEISATPNSFPAGGGNTTLTWSSNGTVTSNWDGPKPSSGSQSWPVSGTRTFRVDCSGPGGPEHEEVVVTVGTPVPPVTPQCFVATNGNLSPSSGSGTPGQTTTVTASFTSQGGAVCGPPYYSSSNSGNVSVNSSTGLITFVSPGSATICAQPQQNVAQPQTCGTFTTTSVTTPNPTVTSVTITPQNPTITLSGTPGACSASQQFSAIVQGTGAFSQAVTWTTVGANVGQTSGFFTGNVAGVYTLTATSVQNGSVTGTTQVTVMGSCQPTSSVVSINVQPETLSCTVGGQTTAGAYVQVTGSASTAVTWSVSDPSVASLGSQNQNQIGLNCLKTGTFRVTATAVADPSKSDYADGTVINGAITCTWTTSTGLQGDGSVIINRGQNITATANCTNPTGASFLPAWFSSDPSRVGVTGQTQTTVNGKVFQTGNTATISGVFTGQAQITVQAALNNTDVVGFRTVIVR